MAFKFDPNTATEAGQDPRPPRAGGFNPASARELGRLSAARSAGDSAANLGASLLEGVQSVTNVAGADNRVSRALGDAADTVRGFESPQRRVERADRARKIREAEESGSTWDEVKAYMGAFAEAPFDTTVGALGTSLPTLAASALTRGRVAPAAMGGVQGAGIVKGEIYEAVEQAHLEAGASPEEAAARASAAQAYDGDNAEQIALGGGLGVLAGTTGVESVASRLLGRGSGQEVARRGVARSIGRGAATEGPTESLQGGQERLAANLAVQNEGFDVPTWQGVAGSAALEGTAGMAAGGGFGAVEGFANRGSRAEPEVTDQADEEAPPTADPEPVAPDYDPTPPGAVPDAYRRETPMRRDQFPATPSQAMGIDPDAGPLSTAAALAVDSGASAIEPALEGEWMPAEQAAGQAEPWSDPGTTWDAMPEPERQALADMTDIRGVLKNNVSRVDWARLNDDLRGRLEAAMGQRAIEGREIDGNWTEFAPQSGTLGIARSEMPQIKAEHRGAMVNFMAARGIAHQEETLPAASLRPTQAEFSREKVAQAKNFKGGNRAILVSADNHVLDGHHQWLAARQNGEQVRAIRLNAPIEQLIQAAHEFPSTTVEQADRPVLQNRDRSAPVYVEQMASIAANPDYGRLGFSRDFTSGAPAVEPGARMAPEQVGATDHMTTAEGRRIPVQYAVIEADQLLASNSIDGSAIPEYTEGAEGMSRAIAGNGRVAGLQAAHSRGTAGGYVQGIIDDARLHGVAPEVVEAMRAPVLVRVMPQDEITDNIGDESNTPGTARLTGSEQARNDTRRVDLGALTFSEDGGITDATVRQFVQAMPSAERGTLLDGSRPSRQAHDRLESAVFASAYESDALVRLQAQAVDPEARNIMRGLLVSAPKMARLAGTGGYDIRGLVAEAAEGAINARRSGRPLAEYVKQVDLSRNPEAQYFLEMFAENIRSAKRIGDALSSIADAFYTEATRAESDMFGAVPRRSRAELLGELDERAESTPEHAPTTGHAGRAESAEASGSRDAAERSQQASDETDSDFALTTQTEEELAAQAQARAEAEAQAVTAEQQAEQRAQADRERDEFVLAGSDTVADQAAARGQRSLLDAAAAPQRALDQHVSSHTDPNLTEKWRSKTRRHEERGPAERTIDKGFYQVDYHKGEYDPADGYLTAVDKETGEVLGEVFFSEIDGIFGASVEVRPDMRRKGIASALYDTAESIKGRKLTKSPRHSPDAAAFWAAREKASIPTDTEIRAQAAPDPTSDTEAAGAQPGFGLETQTEQSLQQQEAQRQEAEAAQARELALQEQQAQRERDAENDRARADEVVDDFRLGQTADEAMSGIDDMFGAPQQEVATESEAQQEDQTALDEIKNISMADLDSLMDDVAEETNAVETSKPERERSTRGRTSTGRPRPKAKVARAERTNTRNADAVDRTASEIAKSIGANLDDAGMSALAGLTNLFGGNGRLNSGLTFDEETYAKAKPHFIQALKSTIAAGKDLRDLVRALFNQFGDGIRPYVRRFAEDVQRGAIVIEDQAGGNDASGSTTNLEQGSQDRGGQATSQAVEPATESGRGESGPDDRGAGVQADGRRGDREQGSAGVQGGSTIAGGQRGNIRSDQPGGRAESEASAAGSDLGERSSDLGNDGVSVEPASTEAVDKASEGNSTASLAEKRELQRQAESIPVKRGSIQNIRQTLPYLMREQQDDVLKAEQRYANPDGYGMLFTNGTGTGKTFTGMGVIKRYVKEGRGNVLVVVPDDKIAADWISSGEPLDVPITQLTSTSDAGEGVTITTYANLGANRALANRQWDLVVADEAHKLMQSAQATPTRALEAVRALTYHPDGFRQHSQMLYGDLHDAIRENREKISSNNKTINNNDTMDQMVAALRQENETLQRQLDKDTAELARKEETLQAKFDSTQGAARPRLLALTATPFSYVETIDWANGYLFDYNEGRAQDGSSGTAGRAYNEGDNRAQFFMENFGYRMRYNRLTRPDKDVNVGLMERNFNTRLRQSGALSGRTISVDYDYDRRFILIESRIGQRIDQALEWLREKRGSDALTADEQKAYGDLETTITEQFDYLSRRYLLEAIKAQAAIPIVKEHMARGRKVVVFHDYIKGGGFNPFVVGHTSKTPLADRRAYDSFKQEFNDLFTAGLESMASPVDLFRSEIPETLVVNGRESKREILNRYRTFQEDESGPQVILVQSAKNAGWSGHDTTGNHQRVLINLGLPTTPASSIQQEGRIYRVGQASNAIQRYMNTGTSWERSAFAQTIAGRAGTVENMAMGEQARALRESFIQAFEDADNFPPGHEGEGTGGKAGDAELNNIITPYDAAKSYYFANQKRTQRNKAKEGKDYFATPEPVGLKMAEWLGLRSGESSLEPSAGHGAIARWLPEDTRRTFVEPSRELSSRLQLVATSDTDKVVNSIFEDLHLVNKFDGIAMNPPFGRGGKLAAEHVQKAMKHLRDGGRIVALVPDGPAADKRFDALFSSDEFAGFHHIANVRLPNSTFERAGTNVATRIMVIEKQENSDLSAQMPGHARTIDLRDADNINDLFDRLEDVSMGERLQAPQEQAEESPAIESVGDFQSWDATHTKTEETLYMAKPARSLDRETYKQVLDKAKEHGGFWDRYTKGFRFKSDEKRKAFLADVSPDGGARFRRADPGQPMAAYSRASIVDGQPVSEGMTVEQVQGIVDEFMQRYSGNIDLQSFVRQTQEDIYGPDATPEQQGIIKGAYHPERGVFTLAASNLSDRLDVERTLRHEILGHYGLDTFAPADKQAILQAIIDSKSERSLRDIWRDIDALYADKSEAVRAEEVFAKIAETDLSTLGRLGNRLLALISRALRAVGLSRGIITRAELLGLVDRIGQNIRERRRQELSADSNARYDNERTGSAVQNQPQYGAGVSEPGGADAGRSEQFDLFDPPEADKKQSYADLYGTIVQATPVTTIRSGIDRIQSIGDAAHVLASIRRDAQEAFYAVATDADGKILRVMQFTRGTKNASSVYPLDVVSEAATIEGIDTLHIAHNHPGGSIDASEADIRITRAIADRLDGTGIKLGHHAIVAGTSWSDGAGGMQSGTITPRARTKTLDITQRRIRRRGGIAAQITGPEEARRVVSKFDNALLLLDNRHTPVAAITLSAEEMRTLRQNGQVRRVMAAIGRSNAAAAIIKTNDQRAAENLSRFLNHAGSQGELRILDWINDAGESAASRGSNITHLEGSFFSRAEPTNSKAFKDWFGDSKIVNNDGTPRVLYHSSDASFTAFDQGQAGSNTGHGSAGLGFFFSPHRSASSRYGQHTMAVYARIENPYRMGLEEFAGFDDVAHSQQRQAELKEQGYDGIIVPMDGTTIAFDPAQIKSVRNRGTFDPSNPDIRFSRSEAPDTPAFKRWFGDSKVVDENGDPLVVYHGTPDARFVSDDGTFKSERDRYGMGRSEQAHWFARSRGTARTYADDSRAFDYQRAEPDVIEAYIKLENPLVINGQGKVWREAQQRGKTSDVIEQAREEGRDGVIIRNVRDNYNDWEGGARSTPTDTYVVFSSEQIKSATDNTGTFDPTNPDIRFSRAAAMGGAAQNALDRAAQFIDSRVPGAESMPDRWTEAQRQAASKFDTFNPKRPIARAIEGIRGRALDRAVQLIVDQFRPLKNLSEKAFMQAHLSKATDGALEATATRGVPILKDGAISIASRTNGFLGELSKLGSNEEARQFLMWVAGNRAESLAAEGRENLFTPEDIAAMKRFNVGRMADGRSRTAAYAAAQKQLNIYNKAVLDIAQEAGLINPESRATWESEFYVPFYRVLEDGKATYSHGQTGLVRQDVVKRLKGGTENLGDPLENVLNNWHSLMTASMRNMAANNALEQAAKMNIATEVDSPGKDTTWTMRNGEKVHWQVDDPMIVDALDALNFNGYNNPAMRTASAFKRYLTIGVTISPAFRIRNLMRDTMQAVATADVSFNPLKNAIDGWHLTSRDSEAMAQLMAGGGAIRFGSFNDGAQRKNAERLISMGVQENQILDSASKWKNAFRRMYDGYQEAGDRAETINRAVIYQRVLEETGSHLEASFAARDLMNFTSMGSSAAVRALAQVLPFFNARIQGMDRLVRGSQADPRRFWATAGTVAMASALLYLLQSDDEEYQALPDYVRDTYWPVKIGGHWLYIPKPFELGSMGTVIERFTEMMLADSDYQIKDFKDSMVGVLTGTLAMNPIPQLVRPAAETWFNYDMFRRQQIDGMGMQRLLPEERHTANTSAAAVQLGRAFGASPQKIEHLMRGYFGWLGTQALNVGDHLVRSVSDMPASPRRDLTLPNNWFVAGEFVRKSGTLSSKYVERFYSVQRELDAIYASANNARNSGDMGRATELMSTPELAMRPAYTAAYRQLSGINQQIRQVTADRSMAASEKNRRLIELRSLRDRITREVDQMARSSL